MSRHITVLIVDARRRPPAPATFHSSAAFTAKANKAGHKHARKIKKVPLNNVTDKHVGGEMVGNDAKGNILSMCHSTAGLDWDSSVTQKHFIGQDVLMSAWKFVSFLMEIFHNF